MNQARFHAEWWASPTEVHVRVFKDNKMEYGTTFSSTGGSIPDTILKCGRIYTTEYDNSPSNLVLRVNELCRTAGFPSHKLSLRVSSI